MAQCVRKRRTADTIHGPGPLLFPERLGLAAEAVARNNLGSAEVFEILRLRLLARGSVNLITETSEQRHGEATHPAGGSGD